MTGGIFSQWLEKINKIFAAKNRKIALILDNCAAHPSMNLENVKLYFLPPNTTSVLQSWDQGIIKNLKHHYRKNILQKYLASIELNENLPVITILDSLYFLKSAWDKVNKLTIEHCFNHSGFEIAENLSSYEVDTANNSVVMEILPNGLSFQDYVCVDENVITIEYLTD